MNLLSARPLFLALLLLPACSPAPSTEAPARRSVHSLTINNTPRSYILRLPPAYDGKTPVPLVLLLHGATDSAAYAEQAYHFAEKADAVGAILVLPDALGDRHAWRPFTGPGALPDDNDDLQFLTSLLDSLPAQYAVDKRRVFVCGHSAGAMMTYRLAAERPDLVAAAGIVAGSMGDADWGVPTPKAPVPLILFHGRKDTNVPYGDAPAGAVPHALAVWRKINGCDKPPTTDRPVPTVERQTFPSTLPQKADLVLYSLDNGNHMWPGGTPMPGKTEQPLQDIPATDLMWTFFTAHPHP
jgi:polyhydroxybutyrate depolymerase